MKCQIKNILEEEYKKAEEDERKNLMKSVPDCPCLSKIPDFVEEYEKESPNCSDASVKSF